MFVLLRFVSLGRTLLLTIELLIARPFVVIGIGFIYCGLFYYLTVCFCSRLLTYVWAILFCAFSRNNKPKYVNVVTSIAVN